MTKVSRSGFTVWTGRVAFAVGLSEPYERRETSLSGSCLSCELMGKTGWSWGILLRPSLLHLNRPCICMVTGLSISVWWLGNKYMWLIHSPQPALLLLLEKKKQEERKRVKRRKVQRRRYKAHTHFPAIDHRGGIIMSERRHLLTRRGYDVLSTRCDHHQYLQGWGFDWNGPGWLLLVIVFNELISRRYCIHPQSVELRDMVRFTVSVLSLSTIDKKTPRQGLCYLCKKILKDWVRPVQYLEVNIWMTISAPH